MENIDGEKVLLIRTVIRTTTAIVIFNLIYRIIRCGISLDLILGFIEIIFVTLIVCLLGLYLFYTYSRGENLHNIIKFIILEYVLGLFIGFFITFPFIWIEIDDFLMDLFFIIIGEISSVGFSLIFDVILRH
ncbi:MAG: hypothetical protein ACFFCE_00360 [Promethearchaeota archaeon]